MALDTEMLWFYFSIGVTLLGLLLFCIMVPLWVLRAKERKVVWPFISIAAASLVAMLGGGILFMGLCFS